MEKKNGNQPKYEVIYKPGYECITDYLANDQRDSNAHHKSDEIIVSDNEGDFKIVFRRNSQIPSYYDTAINILKKGMKLHIMSRNDFVHFISELSFYRGWTSSHICLGTNESIPLITIRNDNETGKSRCIWLVKKYISSRPVGLKIIRELDYLILKNRASKGVIVTTSRLTKRALKLVEENKHIMGYVDHEILEKQLNKVNDDITIIDLPF